MSETRLTEAQYDAITEAAAQWCMRVHEPDCTDREREAFAEWLTADPLHAFEYEAMLEIWDVSEHLPHSMPVAAEVVQMPPVARRSRWQTFAVAAAITLIAAPVAAYSGWQLGWVPSSYQRLQADSQLKTVTLPDGSEVELNLGTQLTFANYKDQRRVTLNKGEAFFKVSHDVTHPFFVRAGEGQVRVTGTKRLSGEGLRLEPGMQARYKAGDYAPQINQTYANAQDLAWRNGKLVLDNLSLSDALPLINRYLDTPLVLADSATGKLRIGGVFNTQDIDRLVTSLPKVLPVYLSISQNGNPVINGQPQG